MTVNTTNTRTDTFADGVAVTFNFDFQTQSTLWVKALTIDTGGNTETRTDISIVLNEDQENSPGGTVTFDTAPTDGFIVRLYRQTPLTQNTDYTEYDAFPAEANEDALDKLTMIAQEEQDPGSGAGDCGSYLPLSGGTMTGPIGLSGNTGVYTYTLQSGIFGENVTGFVPSTGISGQTFTIQVIDDAGAVNSFNFTENGVLEIPNTDEIDDTAWELRAADVSGLNALGLSSNKNGSAILLTTTSLAGINYTWTLGADGTLTAGGKINGLPTPIGATEAANKEYVDSVVGGAVWGSITGTLSSQADLQLELDAKAPTASPTLTGTVTFENITTPANAFELRANEFSPGVNGFGISSTVNNSVILLTASSAGGTQYTLSVNNDGTVTMPGGKITDVANPTADTDAANKAYVDLAAGGGSVWGSITGTLSNQTDLQNALDAKANASNTVTTNTTQTVTGRKSFRNFLDLVNVTTTSKKFEMRCNDFGAINSLGISSSANNSNIILTASNSGGTDFSMIVGNDGQVLLPNVVTSNAAAASKQYVDSAVSDESLKTGINYDIDSSVLHDLLICSYEYRDDSGLPLSPKYRDGIHYGVIAQQAQKVMPEAVYPSSHGDGLLAFDYEMMIPLLVKEVQELRRRIEELERS